MGKKSGNINPVDQERKEARKRELKKNKKQRQQVRQNVLKNRDPKNILIELETLDKIKYNLTSEPPYSSKVIQEKQNRLRETWTRVMHMYEQDDPKLASELKGLEIDYERKRNQLVTQYESIKKAEEVKIDEIPLPDTSMAIISIPAATKSILKSSISSTSLSTNKKPPGPPPGPPPPLTEFDEDDDDYKIDKDSSSKKIRFSDNNDMSRLASTLHTTGEAPPSTHFNVPSMNLQSRYPPGPPPPPLPMNAVPPPLAHVASSQPAKVMQQHKLYNQLQAKVNDEKAKASMTIEAKPVLRNKIAEITKFVPTSLMVKRDNKPSKPNQHREDPLNLYSNSNLPAYVPRKQQQQQQQQQSMKPSSDVAYEQFMKEINKFL